MSYYTDNPHWMAMVKRGNGLFNNTILPRWTQGSVGGNSPMFLWNHEYSYVRVKHGTNFGTNAYDGGVKRVSPLVTPHLQQQVSDCTLATMNPGGCQMAALQQMYTDTAVTPHPYGISYATGRPPHMEAVAPTGRVP